MMPIQDLLNRIKWDADFGLGSFAIGYYDRVDGRIIVVPLQQLEFMEGDHFSFRVTGPFDEMVSIPFHRVRQVFKDGRLIWERPSTKG